jgi:hypothetical protein
MKAGHRRRRPAPTSGIKNKRSSHEAPHRDTTGSATRVRSPSGRARRAPSGTAARATERKR